MAETTAGPYRDRLRDTLTALPDRSDARRVWAVLGEAGLLAQLYQAPDPRPRPGPLGELLAGLDRYCPTGVTLAVCVQVATALPILAGATTPIGQAAYQEVLAGRAVIALAATDSGAPGSDLMGVATEARLESERVVVCGGKRWITNACQCDYLLVLARHRAPRHFTSLLWVLVPAGAPGVSAAAATDGLLAGAGAGHLTFSEVLLDRRYLVGPPGRGLPTFARHVGTERLAGALWAAAMARRVLTDTRRRLADRRLDDRPLWRNDAIRQRFARCLLELRRIEALSAGYLATRDTPEAMLAGMVLKAGVADGLSVILAECAQLHGADGFAPGGPGLLRAEAALFGIAGGATEAMLAGIADHADELLATVPA